MDLKDNVLKNPKKGDLENALKQGRKFNKKGDNNALIMLLKRKYEKYLYQCRTID